MFCTKCGKPLPDGSKFCPNCGTQIAEGVKEAPAETQDGIETKTSERENAASTPEVSTQPCQDTESSDWEASYQKNKMIGLITYKKITTNVKLTSSEIFIEKLAGSKRTDKKASLADIQEITFQKTYDFWDTLYTIILAVLAICCLLVKNWGGTAGLGILAAVCFFSGIGKRIVLQFQDHSTFDIPVKLQCEVDDFVGHVSRHAGRNIPVSMSKAPSTSDGTVSKKKRLFLVGGVVAIGLLGIILLFSSQDNADSKKAIDTVRTGYLGEYTDVTVDTIATYILESMDIDAPITWDGGLTDGGVMIVEASSVDTNGQAIQLQFKMIDDETFRFGALT